MKHRNRKMRRNIFTIKNAINTFLLLVSFNSFADNINVTRTNLSIDQELLYQKLNLDGKINRNVFKKSIEKHNNVSSNDKDLITIIDFSQPSSVKRLAIIDLEEEEILYNEYVSHGSGSGGLKSKDFSNINGSHQSSLGQYKTGVTYQGKHGLSLKLIGKEKSNSNAESRYIVFHGASYATEEFLNRNGYLGRSHGCPAVDDKIAKEIIHLIKNGTYMYAYN